MKRFILFLTVRDIAGLLGVKSSELFSVGPSLLTLDKLLISHPTEGRRLSWPDEQHSRLASC